MPRECTVCAHPDAVLINEAMVVEGKSNRAIASHYGLGREAVRRHKEHIPKLLLKARENLDAYTAASILSKIETLQHETLEQLEGAKDDGDRRVVLGAIREQRANLELVARLMQLINEQPSVTLNLSPAFVQYRTLIVGALDAYPEAQAEVLSALDRALDG